MRVSPSAMVAMDAEGRITALNPAAERLLGTAPGAAEGRPYTEVFGASLASRMVPLFMRASRHAPGTPHEMEVTLPDSRRVRLRASAGPLVGTDGALIGLLFVADDRSTEHAAREDVRRSAQKEERLRAALQRYVGEQVAEQVDERPSFIQIGGARQVVSVLHSDVRGYTTIAEQLEPEAVHALLLRYHGAAVAALESERGMLDRYIGDAILALWNAPGPQEQHALMAIKGALRMRDATLALGSELTYGIGVHTGEAVVGNLGSERYMHYTAIGDTVNVAARLQSGAAGGEVVCSSATLSAARTSVRAVPLGALTVKGRKAEVEAYRVEGVEA